MENREYIKTGSQVYWRTLFIIFLGSMAAFGAEYCVQPIIPVIASSFGLNAVQGSLASIFRIGGDVSSNAADCRFGTAF